MEMRRRSFTHVPFQRTGPSVIPDIYMPFRLSLSPHHQHALEESVAWARRMGLLDAQPGDPASAIWDEQRLRGFDFALCSAGLDPDATPEQLALNACWLTWGTYGDDYYPVAFAQTRNLPAAKAATARLITMIPVDHAEQPEPLTAMERSLGDLWVRTTTAMAADHREEFRTCLVTMLESWVWEVDNCIANRIPDPVDYAEMRRRHLRQ